MVRTQTITILFCDLVASTERRARLGDDAFDEFTGRFMATLRDAIAQHDGREASSAGDGLMVVFPDSVVDAVACAMAMHRAVAELVPDDPPMLRIGISTGEVARDGDDFSGMPIVEAARLEAKAAPGQTLANAIVRNLVGTRRALQFRDVGSLALKGIPAPLATVEVVDEEVFELPRPPAPASTQNRRPHRLALVAVVVVVALVATAVFVATRSGSRAPATPRRVASAPRGIAKPKGYTPTYTSSPCPDDVREAASDATCGHLVVPQDRSRPSGTQVRLLVTRAPARLPGPVTDPTIDVCGCEDLGNSLARDHSELIHLDQRGYGASQPQLTCPEFVDARLQALTRRSNDPAEAQRGTDALRRCHARLVGQGIDPAQYNLDAAAQDVLDLMFALKVPRAHFVAFESAATEAFDVLRRAPGAVRSLTLDNPPPPGRSFMTDSIGDLSGAFRQFVALCDADPACAHGYAKLARKWKAAYARANAHPTLVSGANPSGSNPPTMQLLLDGPRTADALAVALGTGDVSTYKLIPPGITQPGSEGVVASLALQVDRLAPDAPWGTQASYFCAYDVHTEDPQGQAFAARTLPEFVRAHDTHWVQWCEGWKVPDVAAALSSAVVSDVPTLVFRGALSPNGNADWLPRIARGLSHVQTVVFPNLGGDLLADGPPCLSALRRQFLANPKANLATAAAACEKQPPPIPFVAP